MGYALQFGEIHIKEYNNIIISHRSSSAVQCKNNIHWS